MNVTYNQKYVLQPDNKLMIDARLAYRNRDGAAWQYYASSLKRRDLKCVVDIVSV